MKLGKRVIAGASCLLSESAALPKHLKGVIEVSQVFTQTYRRKMGDANRLMDRICEEADTEGIVLMLMPGDADWLPAWYESHGFELIQQDPPIMARPPYKH